MKQDTRVITWPGGPSEWHYFPGFPGVYSGQSVASLAVVSERSGHTPGELVTLIGDLNLPLVVGQESPIPSPEDALEDDPQEEE